MLQKPFNLSLRGKTIDANETNEITWQVSGDISIAFIIDVLLNTDNSPVWSSGKISSYALKYTIPQGTLVNGIEYKIKITIFNQSQQSITSDGDIFQTSSRPIVTVDDMGTVGSFNYNFTGQYSQSEGVSLKTYEVNLYDSKKNLINQSGILTSTPMQYLFTNLQTETDYYIEFQATSIKGLTGTSGLVFFSVFYYRPKQHVSLQAANIDNAGIELSWYVRQIILENNGGEFINNEEIDLTNGTVTGNDGFSIDRDFSLKLWLREFPHNVPLLTLIGDNGSIILKYNAIQEAFLITKTTTLISGSYKSNSIVEYAYLSPYQLIETTGEKAVILIQQVGMDMNLSVTMYN